jgi:hypothetical protein
MRARRADQERHAGEVADRRARRAGRRARCLGASRSARHGRVIICRGNIRKRAEVRAGELLREIAERKERHAGKACQGVARCYPYGSAQTLGARGHQTRWQALVALPLQQREAGCLPGKTPIGGRGLPGDAERARQLENLKALSSSRLPLDPVRPT